jgi:hypothetical protein
LWEYKTISTDGYRPMEIAGLPCEPSWIKDVEYRCTDISCYISKDGEPAIRMLRTEAQKLQQQLGNTVEWRINQSDWLPNLPMDFHNKGVFTYRAKATIKLGGNMVLRDAAWREISLSDKDLYTRWRGGEWRISEAKNCGELNDINWKNAEYELRPKATIKLNGNMVTPEQAAAEWEAKRETHERFVKWETIDDFLYLNNNNLNFVLHSRQKFEYELRPKQPTWTGSREDVIALLKEMGVL